MKEKELEDYTYEELIDYCSGKALMALGRGESIRSIISDTANLVNQWTWKIARKQKEEQVNLFK